MVKWWAYLPSKIQYMHTEAASEYTLRYFKVVYMGNSFKLLDIKQL